MTNYIIAVSFYLAIATGVLQTKNVSASSAAEQTIPSSIALPQIEINGTTLQALGLVSRAAHISGGLASTESGCSTPEVKSWSFPEGTTLGQALDNISRSHSQWHIDGGVINVFLPGGIPPLLQVRVQRFDWDAKSSSSEVVSRLLALSEVSQKAGELGLKELPFEGHSGGVCISNCAKPSSQLADPRVSKDVPLLNILNDIVRVHEGAVWNYSEHRCGGQTKFALTVIGG